MTSMRIRAAQMEAFRQAAVRGFESEMVAHLRRFAPKHFEVLEEADIRKVIRSGMERAPRYGLAAERSVRYFVELMLMLGSGFDSDPQTPWAAAILNGEATAGEAARIDGLYARAREYAGRAVLDYRADEGEVAPTGFVEEAGREREEDLRPADYAGFYNHTLRQLQQRFPNKCAHVGELCLRRLIQHAIETAGAYGVKTRRGAALFVALMFLLGGAFHRDPQLPWASAILNDADITDQNERVNRLHAGALDSLKRWWH